MVNEEEKQFLEYLNTLPFQRDSYYGLGLNWFGVDKHGQIAMFLGADLPIPNQVFNSKVNYMEMYDFFTNLPQKNTGHIVERFKRIKMFSNQMVDYSYTLEHAKRGLYYFEECIFEDQGEFFESYYSIAIPSDCLNISTVPLSIKNLLRPFHFPIEFSKKKQIEVENYLNCD